MVQKINPHSALGCNRSPPPTMYFQKMQFLGVFRPFFQRSMLWVPNDVKIERLHWKLKLHKGTHSKIITRVTRANRWNTIINLVGLCKGLNFFSTFFKKQRAWLHYNEFCWSFHQHAEKERYILWIKPRTY